MSVVRSWLVVATAAAACRLSVVSRCRLSVVGRRLPFVGCSSFFIVRCPLTFVASFWLCLQGSPTAPARLGFGQSMYVHTSALHTHRTCVCPAHLLFPREILHMQPRNSLQLCNCGTVQLCNCSTVQLFNCPTCRALSGMESKSYDFRFCRDVVNASPASVASLAFSAASASAARNLCHRHRMNVGYHCSPDCLANILRLSSPIARREKHKNNKKQKGENGKISKSQRQSAGSP